MCSTEDACTDCQAHGCVYCQMGNDIQLIEYKCAKDNDACWAMHKLEEGAEYYGQIIGVCVNPSYEQPGKPLPDWLVIFLIFCGTTVILCALHRVYLYARAASLLYRLSDGVDFSRRKNLSFAYLRSVGDCVGIGANLVFSKSNGLQAAHLTYLAALADAVDCSVRLDPDFADATDSIILALALLLKEHPKKVTFARECLWLPCGTPKCLDMLVKQLPAIHSIGQVAFENPGMFRSKMRWEPVPVWVLRNQAEKIDVSWHVGDIGASVVCSFISGKPRIKTVAMRNCGLVEPKLDALMELPMLAELNLSSNNLSNTFLKAEGHRFTKLRILTLDRNSLGAPGIPHLQLGQLEELTLGTHLGGNPIRDTGARFIAEKLPGNLRVLRLDNCSIGISGAQAIAAVLPKTELTLLCMDANPVRDYGGKKFAEAIPYCPKLQEMSLTLCAITDESALALAVACPNWMKIRVVNNSISDLCRKSLLEHPSMS
eukprot:GEMP01025799.1.p1 GENE.GEMP01025799.1~~GEMP01025799.1.p1  ORF type:complete len:486 (+),score=80.53 GEMP01025799.1:198-1655(+)